MKTSVERLDGNMVKLTVTVPAKQVDEAIDTAYKRMAKKVKVPGFRAGKAPKPVIDTYVGREAVIGDAQDELLTESYGKALDAEKLRPIAQPEIGEVDLMEPGTEFEYVAEVEIRPELTLSSVEGLSITVPSPKATDREVDAQIEHTSERYATLEPVEDRGIEAGDFALISFVGTVDGEAYEGNTVDKYLYELNRGLMPPEFDEGLLGVETGGETRIEFEIPDTSSNEEYVGKTAAFDVTVHEIKAKVMPALDDEFAASVGGFDTIEEMRASVREQLERSKEIGHRQALEQRSRAALAERLEGDVPEVMVESTRGQMLRDFANSMETRGISLAQYLEITSTTMEKFEADMAEQARQSVREDLALEALFRHLGETVTDEDIDEEIQLFASDSESTPEELRAKWEQTGIMGVLVEQIQQKKAVRWLLDNVEVAEENDEAGEEAPEDSKE